MLTESRETRVVLCPRSGIFPVGGVGVYKMREGVVIGGEGVCDLHGGGWEFDVML